MLGDAHDLVQLAERKDEESGDFQERPPGCGVRRLFCDDIGSTLSGGTSLMRVLLTGSNGYVWGYEFAADPGPCRPRCHDL